MSFNIHHIKTDGFAAFNGGGNAIIITRDNYEAWFVMYVDNELDEAGRKAVDDFIQQNPDLEEELVMLQESVLQPDPAIVFDQKETLFKHTIARNPVNDLNCEEYFVLYSDDELTNEEKEKVELFVYKHPQYQEDFELIQQAKLVPDNTITFPDKAYLYRTEEDDNKVRAFPWWRLSAAAIALLVLGSLGWYITVQRNHSEVAGTVETTIPGAPKNNTPQVTAKNNNEASPAATDKTISVVKEATPAEKQSAVPTVDAMQPGEQVAFTASHKKNISTTSNIQHAINVTQESTQQIVTQLQQNDNDISARPVAVVVANSYNKPAVNGTVVQNTVSEHLTVRTAATVTADEQNNNQGHTYVLNTSINKTPLRGFFRKVSRVVERVTNPDENGKGGVRIANLEIALQ